MTISRRNDPKPFKIIVSPTFLKKKFEDTKVIIRSVNQRSTDHVKSKGKRRKGQTMIYKTLHRKLHIEIYEFHLKSGMNST